ncbi:MAG: helix-turn-helix transcriptional regulator [Burkholderiaceae bacterium]
MPEYLTTKELAELLRIKERKVYDLAANGVVPVSKAMGKLLFPREAVYAWLARNSSGFDLPGTNPVPNVVLGSHDPLLEWALRESECTLATFFDGSADGLARFISHEGIATGLHLYGPSGWNLDVIRERCAVMPVVLVEWARRWRGLIIAPGLAQEVRSLADLNKRHRLVPRQPQAGAQGLLMHCLAGHNIREEQLTWVSAARSESDAVSMVHEAKAEVAFGLQALAGQFRLPFIPVIEERFDLLVNRRAWFEPPMQKFLTFCNSPAFAARAAEMDGYDVSGFGTVHFNGAS